ncbi:DUF4386 domain-containing protein [Streptomyces sp. AB3(2024)]|uniref:DUF4386 domain-containing protein n=1 Tax=Streptomyces sp. AB3(2024) TaxID=3317321 RepID=UPI0035A37E05
MRGPDRRTAVATGVLFLLTEVAAIAGAVLYRPLLGAAEGRLAPGADTRALLGVLCELVLVAAVTGTGAALFPVLRRRGEGMALGYVCGRLLEAALIAVGIVAVLGLVTLRRDSGGAAGGAADAALVAVHDWTFLLGPNIALGVNTVLLASLAYRARLVPRPLALLGLVGGPLICASAVAVMFGLYAQLSVPGSLAALPVFAWELGFAGWVIARGFGPHGTSVPGGRRGDRAGHAGSAVRGESIRHARAS